MKVRSLIFDEDFVKENSHLIIELISLKEPIPIMIRAVVLKFHHHFNRERLIRFGNDKRFMDQVRKERFVSKKLDSVEAREYHNNIALNFIEKHPEFSPIIKEVKYIDI